MLLSPASMPAEPAPATVMVVCSVMKTRFSMDATSSRMSKKAGSRYPTMGWDMALSTRGFAELGPGPSIMRLGTGLSAGVE